MHNQDNSAYNNICYLSCKNELAYLINWTHYICHHFWWGKFLASKRFIFLQVPWPKQSNHLRRQEPRWAIFWERTEVVCQHVPLTTTQSQEQLNSMAGIMLILRASGVLGTFELHGQSKAKQNKTTKTSAQSSFEHLKLAFSEWDGKCQSLSIYIYMEEY